MPQSRTIAIIRDGYSDFLVLRKFIQVIFNREIDDNLTDKNFYEFDSLKIFDPLSKYLEKVSKTEDYSFNSDAAKEFIDTLIPIYYASISKLQRELDTITNQEIIIINADSERLLLNKKNYFKDWAYSIKSIIQYSIELFYEKLIEQGYTYNNIPYFLPLILFPSSEILVASCIYDFKKENVRELKPTPALKQKVYGSSSIPEALNNGNLTKILNTHITAETINNIYRELPEIRQLIHSLVL